MKTKQKPTGVKILQWVYVLVLLSVLATVFLLHSTRRPFLDILRIPTFFRGAEPYVGVSYITSMTVYHFTFAYFLLIIFIDAVALFFYSNIFLKKLSLLSSYAGLILLTFILVYFLYSLAIVGFRDYGLALSASFFIFLSIFFFSLDLITFLVEKRGSG